jgi:hypothetical protein
MIDGSKDTFELDQLANGRIFNGKTYWDYNKGRSKLENFKALYSYFESGTYKFASRSLFSSVAHAGLVAQALRAAAFVGSAYMTIAVAVTTIFELPIIAGVATTAALFLMANAAWNAIERGFYDIEVECVDGKVVFKKSTK